MSLRRRIFGTSSSTDPPSSEDTSREGTPGAEDLRVVPSKHLQKLAQKAAHARHGTKRRNAWIFVLGGLFGIAVAAFFAGNQDMLDLRALADVNLDSLLDVLPAGLIRDAQALQVGYFC